MTSLKKQISLTSNNLYFMLKSLQIIVISLFNQIKILS